MTKAGWGWDQGTVRLDLAGIFRAAAETKRIEQEGKLADLKYKQLEREESRRVRRDELYRDAQRTGDFSEFNQYDPGASADAQKQQLELQSSRAGLKSTDLSQQAAQQNIDKGAFEQEREKALSAANTARQAIGAALQTPSAYPAIRQAAAARGVNLPAPADPHALSMGAPAVDTDTLKSLLDQSNAQLAMLQSPKYGAYATKAAEAMMMPDPMTAQAKNPELYHQTVSRIFESDLKKNVAPDAVNAAGNQGLTTENRRDIQKDLVDMTRARASLDDMESQLGPNGFTGFIGSGAAMKGKYIDFLSGGESVLGAIGVDANLVSPEQREWIAKAENVSETIDQSGLIFQLKMTGKGGAEKEMKRLRSSYVNMDMNDARFLPAYAKMKRAMDRDIRIDQSLLKSGVRVTDESGNYTPEYLQEFEAARSNAEKAENLRDHMDERAMVVGDDAAVDEAVRKNLIAKEKAAAFREAYKSARQRTQGVEK